jgi:integrase
VQVTSVAEPNIIAEVAERGSQGADVKTVQELMRHANASVTLDHYVQAVTPAKREAQRGIIGQLEPNGAAMVQSITASS